MGSRVEVTHEALEIDSGEKRLNELGYKQELRREMVVYLFFIKFEFEVVQRCLVTIYTTFNIKFRVL